MGSLSHYSNRMRKHKSEFISQDEFTSNPDDWRDKRFDPRPREQSNRQRLMLGSSRAAVVWAGMPKPDGKGAK